MRPDFTVLALVFSISIGLGCTEDSELLPEADAPEQPTACAAEGLLENFTDPDGNEIYIYEDGSLFLNANGSCQFELQYFESDFESRNYTSNASGTFLTDGTELIPIKNTHFEDFEATGFIKLFVSNVSDTGPFWTGFTLQSPQAPTVSEYVALSKCILDASCTFLDNTINLVQSPTQPSNQVIEFKSVAPTTDMVTSKCSMSTVLGYFKKDMDLWYEAQYYIKSGMPYSIVDFENAYFEGSPGPRVVIRDNRLEIENKFGSKSRYPSNNPIEVPLNQWFKVKVHLKFSNEGNGVIALWQDGVPLISTTGINLPTSNAIQNIVEIGISATQQESVLLMDEMRISDTAF